MKKFLSQFKVIWLKYLVVPLIGNVLPIIYKLCEQIYRSQWINVFINTNIAGLKEDAIKGELRSSNFRSICWRIFLNILPSNSSEWLPAIEKLRHKYNTIKMNHLHNPHGQESGPDNPLSQADDVCFSKY